MLALLRILFLPLSLYLFQRCRAVLVQCPGSTDGDFDFVVVGAGAGGGPIAARLAESGFTGIAILVSVIQSEQS